MRDKKGRGRGIEMIRKKNILMYVDKNETKKLKMG